MYGRFSFELLPAQPFRPARHLNLYLISSQVTPLDVSNSSPISCKRTPNANPFIYVSYKIASRNSFPCHSYENTPGVGVYSPLACPELRGTLAPNSCASHTYTSPHSNPRPLSYIQHRGWGEG